MMIAAILLAKTLFKDVCKIEFTDYSNKNGLPLSSVMLVFHQQTWYERWFGAQLKEPAFRNIYKQTITRFYTPDSKLSISYFTTMLDKTNIDNQDKTLILEIYSRTSTYKHFFDELRNTIPAPDIYHMIKPWLSVFIDDLGLKFVREQTWEIPCANFTVPPTYSLQQLTHDPYGGVYTSVTRKQTAGASQKLTLSPAERRAFQMPNWIGWLHINDSEYIEEDRIFLKELRDNLFKN